jgi:uncharacterized membrane protein
MNTKKFIIGTLAGGITFFFLGYLFYGMALASFFTQHTTNVSGAMKSMNELVWWALILGNLAVGGLLTYVYLKLGNIGSFGSGASTGAAIGFFLSLSRDLIRYATENSFDITAVIVDVLVGIVMAAIAGGVIGALLGRGKIIK